MKKIKTYPALCMKQMDPLLSCFITGSMLTWQIVQFENIVLIQYPKKPKIQAWLISFLLADSSEVFNGRYYEMMMIMIMKIRIMIMMIIIIIISNVDNEYIAEMIHNYRIYLMKSLHY